MGAAEATPETDNISKKQKMYFIFVENTKVQ